MTSWRQLPFLLRGVEFLHPSDLLQQCRHKVLQVARMRIMTRKSTFLSIVMSDLMDLRIT